MVFFEGGKGAMEVKHCCVDCGQVMAVHEHSSYQEVKDCLASMRPLCDECWSWPGCPLLKHETRGHETQALKTRPLNS
jgi:hypothetical protein